MEVIMTIDKGKILKTVGWTTVGFGLYLVGLSIRYEGESTGYSKPDDGIIDAEFIIIND